MRIVLTTALVAVLAAGGAASAQLPGNPPRAGVTVEPVRASYTVEPFAPAMPITIQRTGVRLRAEPFTGSHTPVLSSGSTGLQLNVVGVARLSDWVWYQVVLKNGQKAFIRSDLTSAPMRGGASHVSAPAPVTVTPQPNPSATPSIALPLPSVSSPVTNTPTPVPSTPAPSNGGLISVAPSAPVPRMTSCR